MRRGVQGPLKGPEKILNLDARRGRLKVDSFENSTPKIYFPFHFISAFLTILPGRFIPRASEFLMFKRDSKPFQLDPTITPYFISIYKVAKMVM